MLNFVRGLITNDNWHYNNRVDALILRNLNEFPILLNGITILTPENGCTVNLKIYKKDDDKESFYIEEKIFSNTSKTKTPIEFILKEAIKIPKKDCVTITINQMNNNQNMSYKTSSTSSNYHLFDKEENEINISLENSSKDTNSTTTRIGAFPSFFITPLISENDFTLKNFTNIFNYKKIQKMKSHIAKEYDIRIDYLTDVCEIIEKMIQYQKEHKCLKCKEIFLPDDVIKCCGRQYVNPKNSWNTETCKNSLCEKCFDLKTIYHLEYEVEEKIEIEIGDDDIDLSDGGIFDQEILDINKELIVSERNVCSDCYQHAKVTNNCMLCHIIYDPTSIKYQRCHSCELKRVCRQCIREDFINNKCKFCNEESENNNDD